MRAAGFSFLLHFIKFEFFSEKNYRIQMRICIIKPIGNTFLEVEFNMRKLIAVLAIIAMSIIGMAGAAEIDQDPVSGEIMITVKNPAAGIYACVNENGNIVNLHFAGENVVGNFKGIVEGGVYFEESVAYWDSRWVNGENPSVKVINGMLDASGIQSGDILRLLPIS
jgi:hypothetical protein